jgi:hypothetical protein
MEKSFGEILGGTLGLCLAPVIVVWLLSYFLMKKTLRVHIPYGFLQGVSLVGAYLLTAIFVALVGVSNSFNIVLIVAFVASVLSIYAVSKIKM